MRWNRPPGVLLAELRTGGGLGARIWARAGSRAAMMPSFAMQVPAGRATLCNATLAAVMVLALPDRPLTLTINLNLQVILIMCSFLPFVMNYLIGLLASAIVKATPQLVPSEKPATGVAGAGSAAGADGGASSAAGVAAVAEAADAASSVRQASEGEEAKEAEPDVVPSESLSTKQLMQALQQAVLAWRNGKGTGEEERQEEEEKAVEEIQRSMGWASPCFLHRFPASAFDDQTLHSATPPFMACERLWCLRTGSLPTGSLVSPMRFFSLLPHGHNDRLRCSLIFAKRPGEGFKERLVIDWPAELAGHPWGPTVSSEELAQYRQADGSVLVMVHGLGLGSENEPS